MTTPIIIAFAFGVLVGLVFGPAKERIDAAHMDGWINGYRAGRRA